MRRVHRLQLVSFLLSLAKVLQVGVQVKIVRQSIGRSCSWGFRVCDSQALDPDSTKTHQVLLGGSRQVNSSVSGDKTRNGF